MAETMQILSSTVSVFRDTDWHQEIILRLYAPGGNECVGS